MTNRKRPRTLGRTARKLGLSAFLIFSFGAYAAEHTAQSGEASPVAAPSGVAAVQPAATAGAAPENTATSPAPAIAAPTDGPPAPASAPAPASEPTATTAPEPAATAAPVQVSNGLKDGTFTGPSVDVQWGLVQVRATVRGGKLTDVQFLQYPRDRRTSQRINSQANPWLQQEAIQAQSANVDLISGATLTSEGFVESLQGALDQAGASHA